MSDLLHPSRGAALRDHGRDHRRHLRDLQQRNEQRRAEAAEAEAAAAIPANPAFAHIKSRLFNENPETSGSKGKSSGKSSGNSSKIAGDCVQAVELQTRKTRLGDVPAYLLNRKREWAEQRERQLAALSDEQ